MCTYVLYVYILYIYNIYAVHTYTYLCMNISMYVYSVAWKLSFLLRKAKLCPRIRCQEVPSHSFPLQRDLWMD